MTAFFGASPEEIDRHQALHANAQHEVNRLLHDLDDDQLRVLEMVFTGLAQSNSTDVLASNLAGKIATIRDFKFKACAACGRNHDAEAAELAENPQPDVPEHVQARRNLDEQTWTPLGSVGPLTERENEIMEEYGLDDLREEGTMKLLGFICMNCQMHYGSIQDRMEREPGIEFCGGCQQKTRWG